VNVNETVPVGAENAGIGAVIVMVAVNVEACVTTVVHGVVVHGKQAPPAARVHTSVIDMALYCRTTLTVLAEADAAGAKFAVGNRASGTYEAKIVLAPTGKPVAEQRTDVPWKNELTQTAVDAVQGEAVQKFTTPVGRTPRRVPVTSS
jgi:hypothetical protein